MRLKKRVRHSIEKALNKPVSYIAHHIGDVDAVSFDVFDTLVLRNCTQPTDVFDFVELVYNKRHPHDPIRSFKKQRLEAEIDAAALRENGATNISEIYDMLDSSFGPSRCEELQEIEIEVELSLCRPNQEMKHLYDSLIEHGVRVYITTDMYLPVEVIDRILKNCGYLRYSGLFLSSDTGYSKRNGTQFSFLLESEGIDASYICHIGDTFISDYAMSRKHGIRSFLYQHEGSIGTECYKTDGMGHCHLPDDSLQSNMLINIINYGVTKDDSPSRQLGYSVLGPILLGYTLWLHNLCTVEKAEGISFLAREGRVLKRAYEAVFPRSAEANTYVHVSRHAVCRASAYQAKTMEELESIFSSLLRDVNTVAELLLLVNPDVDLSVLDEFEYGIKDRDYKQVDQDMLFRIIENSCSESFDTQGRLAKRYLEQNVRTSNRVILSDVGWSGTMQYYLEEILGIVSIGAYMAVNDYRAPNKRMDRRGYWCGPEEWDSRGQSLRFTTSAFEALFLSTEGTTIGYEERDGSCTPVLAENENCKEARECIDEMQCAALEFIEDCVKSDVAKYFASINRQVAFLPYFNCVANPSKTAMRFYNEFMAMSTVGSGKHSIISAKSLPYYLLHLNECYSDFKSNSSKILWLKSIIRLPLPYDSILNVISMIQDA